MSREVRPLSDRWGVPARKRKPAPQLTLDMAKTVGRGGRREGAGRVVQYSVQADHVHLIVEADAAALSRGMRSSSIRTAKRLNRRVLRRRGKVWYGRYHRRDLKTPREVRNALVYVLGNGVKHGEVKSGSIDPCSSRRWKVFPGFLFPSEVPRAAR